MSSVVGTPIGRSSFPFLGIYARLTGNATDGSYLGAYIDDVVVTGTTP